MSKVIAQMSISLDGFYAGPLHPPDDPDWVHGPEAAGFFRISHWATETLAWRQRLGFDGGDADPNSEIIAESFDAAGAYVMGRRMFDGGDGPWGDEPPFRAPVFVITNRPREPLARRGGTTFTFVTDGPASAVEHARAAAGGKDVAVAGGGTTLRRLIASGLVDELELHIAPVLLGDGLRLFDQAELGLSPFEGIELAPVRVVDMPTVTHVRYRIGGRRALGMDERSET